MIIRTSFVWGVFVVGIFQFGELAAQPPTATGSVAGTVYLDETFESFDVGATPDSAELERVKLVTVVEGGGKVGSAKVAHFNDNDTQDGGAMEYNVGQSALTSLYIEFDALNNDAAKGDKNSAVIFGVGPWEPGRPLMLNAKSKRAFGFEMYQQKNLKLRVGEGNVCSVKYDAAAAFNVKIWTNDHDTHTLAYKRPDNGETATLGADSVVIWLNDALMEGLEAAGTPMHKDVTAGDAVIGRAGFSSASTKVADFLFDNLHIQGPSGEAESADSVVPAAATSSTTEQTPESMPGAEKIAYRNGENAMDLFVYKPLGWQAGDKRSAYVFFFGGGWTRGTPLKSAYAAKWAADNGMVGIAPDYRTKNRFGTSPLAAVDDGRAAVAWVVEHADELGIDPTRIAVGGSSAGGHVALWTAIEKAPPGSDAATSPKVKPAAVFLTSAVTDTSPATGYTPQRFGDDALALSPVHQLDAEMPPTLIVHAANDELVHYGTAVALYNKLVATDNVCELMTVPVGGHGFASEHPLWKAKRRAELEELFERAGLLRADR